MLGRPLGGRGARGGAEELWQLAGDDLVQPPSKGGEGQLDDELQPDAVLRDHHPGLGGAEGCVEVEEPAGGALGQGLPGGVEGSGARGGIPGTRQAEVDAERRPRGLGGSRALAGAWLVLEGFDCDERSGGGPK